MCVCGDFAELLSVAGAWTRLGQPRASVNQFEIVFVVFFDFSWELIGIIKRILFDLMGGSLLVVASTTKKPPNSSMLILF